MNKIKLFALATCIVTASSVAISETDQNYTSPAGNVQIFEKDYEKFLQVGETTFALGGQSLVNIHQPVEPGFSEHFPNHFLIYEWGGGSMCRGLFRWLNASETPPRLTEKFGTCTDGYDNLRVENGRAVFELYGAGSEGFVSFIYDGEAVTERNAGLDGVSEVENPFDPNAWIDQHPWTYLVAPANEAFLTELLTWDVLNHLRFYSVGTNFILDGDWVVGTSCQGGQCDTNKLVIAISKTTAAPYIAYKSRSHRSWQFFGNSPDKMPNSLRGILAKG